MSQTTLAPSTTRSAGSAATATSTPSPSASTPSSPKGSVDSTSPGHWPDLRGRQRPDRQHQPCLDLLRSAEPPFVVPSLVVAEASYLVGENLGPAAETDFFLTVCSDRFRIEPVTDADLARIVELTQTYADLPLGGTDASAQSSQ